MGKLAIDVVLLLPKQINDLAIEKNKEFIDKDILDIDFKVCLPHLSLLMGVIDEKNMSKAGKIIDNILEQFSALNLEISQLEIMPFESTIFTNLKIKPTEELLELQKALVDELTKLFEKDCSKEMFFDPKSMLDKDVRWVGNFLNYLDRFNPHITLGRGECSGISKEIPFKATKLAICHLGSNCTCRRILYSNGL